MKTKYQTSRFVFVLSILFLLAALANGRSFVLKPVSAQSPGGKVFLPIISLPSIPPNANDWATLAANPQRTSWVSEEVRGSVSSGTAEVLWYRPIEAYIPQNVQIIASYDTLYISTARGLYALNASTGALAWRFDTELPLGNSPTVSNGVVYVGGYDRKLYALDAFTGAKKWEFAGAEAGYSANPLVVDGKVFIGSRDGYMYAVAAHGAPNQGQMLWRYKAGGPIIMSAAYKNNVVYFASNDNHAYAVNGHNGALLWKSAKLPGDGFSSYWPVVYTNPATGSDVVIFPTASAYRAFIQPGSDPVAWQDLFSSLFGSSSTLGPIVNINEPWASGKTIVNYSKLAEYFENNPAKDPYKHKPWQREYVILNASSGSEFTYDSDNDGYGEYTPVIGFKTNSGNNYPPVVGSDNLLYFSGLYFNNGQGRVLGWRIGTPYLALTNNQGDTAEPQALSSGGKVIYRSICCDRVGDWFDSTPQQQSGLFWHYGFPLSDIAPIYDSEWWFSSPDLDRLYGNFGNVNGIYHNHGVQNSIVPYQGKTFIHRSNAVIAFGSGQNYGRLATLTANSVTTSLQTPNIDQLKNRLEAEVQKIVATGHMRPGYYNAGQFNDAYPQLADYFNNPGDTLLTLSRAYPYLSAGLQQQVRTYLQNEYRAYFDPTAYSHIGWADGVGREAMQIPSEVSATFINYPKKQSAGPDWSWQYPQYNIYALWKYAQVFPADVGRIYDVAKSKLQVPVPGSADNAYFQRRPWEHNGYVAGYIGFLRLQEMAGKTTADAQLRTTVTNELNRLQQLRASTFSKDTYYTADVVNAGAGHNLRTMNVSRNFIMLVPEFGDYLNQNALVKVRDAVNEYNFVGPYWFVSRYDASNAESAMQNLYDYGAVFQAKAYILKQSRAELTKYLDVPAFERGDLFYIQNLIAALEAP